MKLTFLLFFMKWIVVWPLKLNEWSKVLIFYCWRHWTRYNWWVLYWKTFIKRQSIIGMNFLYPSILRSWLQYHSLIDCFYTKEIVYIEKKNRTIHCEIWSSLINEKAGWKQPEFREKFYSGFPKLYTTRGQGKLRLSRLK